MKEVVQNNGIDTRWRQSTGEALRPNKINEQGRIVKWEVVGYTVGGGE